MSILSGFFKTKKLRRMADGNYKLQSEWTSSETVEMADGNTAEENLGSIKGITSSLASTDSGYALAADAGKNLQDKVNELNSNLGYFMGYSLDDGVRVTTIRYVEINNYFYYMELNNDELPSGYKLAEFPMILATSNTSAATYPILYADRAGDSTIRVVFGGTITGSLNIVVQYTIVPA